MIEQATRYGLRVTASLPYDLAVARTRDALAREGFGVLTEIDVREIFRKKLGVEFRPWVIFGACNPPLANRALNAELDIGLLLPCNVVVYTGYEASTSVIAAMDPEAALELSNNADIADVARDVKARILRVLDAVAIGENVDGK